MCSGKNEDVEKGIMQIITAAILVVILILVAICMTGCKPLPVRPVDTVEVGYAVTVPCIKSIPPKYRPTTDEELAKLNTYQRTAQMAADLLDSEAYMIQLEAVISGCL